MPRRSTRTLEQRIFDRIAIDDGCWAWIGSINRENGYGQFTHRETGVPTSMRAHRAVYELLVGPIPEGLTIDHLCCNKACVRPSHLEPVTHVENMRRASVNGLLHGKHPRAKQTHCLRGHEFTPENTRRNKNGTRICVTCNRERCAAYYAATKDDQNARRRAARKSEAA